MDSDNQFLHKACAALADPTRRAILERLSSSSLAVTDLAAAMPVSRSAVSQHLKLLKEAGLVREARSGRYNIYQTDSVAMNRLSDYVTKRSGSSPPRDDEDTSSQHHRDTLDTPSRRDQVDNALGLWPELWPDQDPTSAGLSARLMFIARLMNSALEKSASKRNLSGVELMILGTLKRLGPPFESTPTNLAKASLLSPPGMSKRLDRLQQRGLIERRPGSQDRRSVDVRLTKTGHEIIDYLIKKHTQDYLVAFQLPEEEQKALNHVLRKILLRVENRMRTSE